MLYQETCPYCNQKGNLLRVRRNWLERTITYKNHRKLKCPECKELIKSAYFK